MLVRWLGCPHSERFDAVRRLVSIVLSAGVAQGDRGVAWMRHAMGATSAREETAPMAFDRRAERKVAVAIVFACAWMLSGAAAKVLAQIHLSATLTKPCSDRVSMTSCLLPSITTTEPRTSRWPSSTRARSELADTTISLIASSWSRIGTDRERRVGRGS